MSGLKNKFTKIAHSFAEIVGTPAAFILAFLTIVVWLLSGPLFHFSDTWQLVINTTTTIVTFLMVFLIQNAQNRDSESVHLKLDELIRAVSKARTELVGLEDLPQDELDEIRQEFADLHDKLHKKVRSASAPGGSAKPRSDR